MATKLDKYQGFNTSENTVVGGAALANLSMLTFALTDQVGATVIGLKASIAIGVETSLANSNLHGVAVLRVNRRGVTAPVLVAELGWNDTTVAGTVNDSDQGDVWALIPFAVPGGANAHLEFDVKTKRSIRRGDTVELFVSWTNSGVDNAVVGWAAAGTLWLMA